MIPTKSGIKDSLPSWPALSPHVKTALLVYTTEWKRPALIPSTSCPFQGLLLMARGTKLLSGIGKWDKPSW